MTARISLLAMAMLLNLVGVAVGENQEKAVRITPELDGVTTMRNGTPMRIERNQDQSNTIHPSFQRTSRRCPPFCVQPMHMPDGVETIGEIEMLRYLERVGAGDDSVLVIDSRGPDWLKRGTIPGSVNIHYKRLSLKSSDESEVARILEQQFGAERTEVQLTGQRGLDTPARSAVLARHRTTNPGPVIELLFGRPALASPFGGCAVEKIGGKAGDAVGVVGHQASCNKVLPA